MSHPASCDYLFTLAEEAHEAGRQGIPLDEYLPSVKRAWGTCSAMRAPLPNAGVLKGAAQRVGQRFVDAAHGALLGAYQGDCSRAQALMGQMDEALGGKLPAHFRAEAEPAAGHVRAMVQTYCRVR